MRQAGFAFKNARHHTATVGAERNAATTTPGQARLARAQAQHPGLGRRGGVKIVRLYSSRVEAREGLYSCLVALGSGACEPVSGFAEVDFCAFSVPVANAKVILSRGKALICREREVPERFFKFLLRMKESP